MSYSDYHCTPLVAASYYYGGLDTLVPENKKRRLGVQNYGLKFRYLAKALIDQTNWSLNDFYIHTNLDKNNYYNLKKAKENQYTKRIVVTLAVAFDLEFSEAIHFIQSAGYSLMTGEEVDNAYISLLVNYSGQNISVCNDILSEMGIGDRYLLGPVSYNK